MAIDVRKLGDISKVNDKLSKMQKVDIDENNLNVSAQAKEQLADYRNIAIFGIDSREDTYSKGNRSDCIIIASINNKTKEVKLVSVYRDTYVQIEGHGLDKITHAYSFGEAPLAIKTLNTNLGGINEMDKLPSLIFLADSKKEYICTKEARKLGIPTIGLIDSNCNPDDVDYVIPGNDDAVRSVSLIAGKIADAVVEAKEGNLTEAPVDEEVETMDELIKKEGVDKIERKPRQNNRRNNYQRKDRVSKENKVEEKSEENK